MTAQGLVRQREDWCLVCGTMTFRAGSMHAECETQLNGMTVSELTAALEQALRCQAQSERANEARRVTRWGRSADLYRGRLAALTPTGRSRPPLKGQSVDH